MVGGAVGVGVGGISVVASYIMVGSGSGGGAWMEPWLEAPLVNAPR